MEVNQFVKRKPVALKLATSGTFDPTAALLAQLTTTAAWSLHHLEQLRFWSPAHGD